jgi:hypothetical protein
VIAPGKYQGLEMVVVATYGDGDVYVAHEDRILRCRRSEVEAVHVRDWDNGLLVTGKIDGKLWHTIQSTLQELYGGWNKCLSSGWSGENGRMYLRFDSGTAAARLETVKALCEPHGLTVVRPEPEW